MWRLDLCFSFYQHPKRVNLFLEFFKINLPSATYIENQEIVWYATKFTIIRAHNCECVRILGRTCMHIAPIFPCRCLKFCPLIGFASPKFFPWLHPCTVLNTKNNIINDFLRNPHCSSSLKLQNWIFFVNTVKLRTGTVIIDVVVWMFIDATAYYTLLILSMFPRNSSLSLIIQRSVASLELFKKIAD